MARPLKNSLSYFSFDTDFFNRRRIKRLLNGSNGKGGFGGKGALVFICLLCEAYRENGYYVEWDAEYGQDIADTLGAGFSAGLVTEVKKSCLEIGLFDKKLFEQHSILTSASMQARFLSVKQVTGKRIYKIEDIIKPEYISHDIAGNCGELPGITENHDEIPSNPVETKVNKRNNNNNNRPEKKKNGVFDASAFLPPPGQTEDPVESTIDGKIVATVAHLEEFRAAIGATQLSEIEKMHISHAIEQGCTVEHLKKLLLEKPEINSFKSDWVIRSLIAVKRKSEAANKGKDSVMAELEEQYGSIT